MGEPIAKRARGLGEQAADYVVLKGGSAYPDACIERWRRGDHCDVVLLDKSRHEHPTHRIVLASGSAFMDGMFCSGMKESEQTSIQIDLSKSSLTAALEWMYCGEVSVQAHELLGLFESAAFLQMDTLQSALSQAISTRLTIDNCLVALNLAEGMAPAAIKLEMCARSFALRHFEVIATRKLHRHS